MMSTRTKNIFDQALDLLRERKFSLALQLASQAARNYKLYRDHQSEFGNIRLLAFEAHDFDLAAEKLTILLRTLSDEINRGQTP